MHKILLENMTFHAKHGVFEEEQIIGGNFQVDIEMETDFTESMKTDNLNGTIDYSKVYTLIEQQLKIPSKLIEHLGKRIIDLLYAEFPSIQHIKLKVSKLNPPISGEIDRVSIIIEE